MGEWLLSRRDNTIVARHEVPRYRDAERPRPGGTVEGIVSSISIVPLGRGYFPHHPRHFVPGYYRAVRDKIPSTAEALLVTCLRAKHHLNPNPKPSP
jgi:hypothetical protein